MKKHLIKISLLGLIVAFQTMAKIDLLEWANCLTWISTADGASILQNLKSEWEAKGDTLIVLTYHEEGNMTPLILQINGIAARARTKYYGMAMGGVKANGQNAPAINEFFKEVYDVYDTIPRSVNFDFSSSVSDTDPNTVNITVNSTATKSIPEGVKLHIIVSERQISWSKVWPEGITNGSTVNGQSFMYDVIWDIIGDTLGNDFPALSAGGTNSMTHPFTINPDMQTKDSIEVTAILQVVDTKEILAVSRMAGSPFSGNNPITSKGLSAKMKAISLNVIGNKATFKIPFKNTEVSLFNASGKMLSKVNFKENKGHKASITLPKSKGVILMRMNSLSGEVITERLIIK